MPSHFPLWFQGLSAALSRRLELAEAAAWEARVETHAAQALELVRVLAVRMPFDDAVDRYIEVMDLGGDQAETIRTRALAALSEPGLAAELARERPRSGWGLNWRDATPLGAVRFVKRQIRRSAEEDLWLELTAARAEEALALTHIQHALIFASILAEEAAPPRSVSLYLDRLEVPAARARGIYQRALAQLADQYLPSQRGPADPNVVEPASEPARA